MLSKEYSPNDWGQWGFLAKVTYCKNGSTCSQFKTSHASGFYGTWSLYQIWINSTIQVSSMVIVYMHQTHIVVDYYTKYEQNQHFLFWDITRHKMYEMYCLNLAWSQVMKCYFTWINNTSYRITLLNMNKINPFFSKFA